MVSSLPKRCWFVRISSFSFMRSPALEGQACPPQPMQQQTQLRPASPHVKQWGSPQESHPQNPFGQTRKKRPDSHSRSLYHKLAAAEVALPFEEFIVVELHDTKDTRILPVSQSPSILRETRPVNPVAPFNPKSKTKNGPDADPLQLVICTTMTKIHAFLTRSYACNSR